MNVDLCPYRYDSVSGASVRFAETSRASMSSSKTKLKISPATGMNESIMKIVVIVSKIGFTMMHKDNASRTLSL